MVHWSFTFIWLPVAKFLVQVGLSVWPSNKILPDVKILV